MKSTVIYTLLLTLLHGNVFTEQTEQSNDRIVNGTDANIENYRYIVHLRARLFCGASVITYSHALTAAHCVHNVKPASISLYGGSTSRSSGGIKFNVDSVVVHPNYERVTLEYDVAIVHVSNTFKGYKNIEPIALQNAEVPAGTSCYVAGWGLTSYKTLTPPDKLQYAVLKVLSAEECSKRWIGHKTIICAQQGNGVNICEGDSGGPLVCDGKLTGAASFVGGECRSNYPATFAKILNPNIRKFISTNAGV